MAGEPDRQHSFLAVPLTDELSDVDLAVPGHVGGAGVADVRVVLLHHGPSGSVVADEPVEGVGHVAVTHVPTS